MAERWGAPPGERYVHDGAPRAGRAASSATSSSRSSRRAATAWTRTLIYHQPDLPPTHHYHALYRWLRDDWSAPTRSSTSASTARSSGCPARASACRQTCYPDLLLGDLPLIYPFIINDPGEGAQAKRRAHAVIVDHLTPPMTTADAYGELDELARLVDEYYQVETLDPSKLPLLQQQIWELIVEARLDADIS